MPAANAPAYFRTHVFRAAPASKVDREAGIIPGYAVITRGEALSYDQWIDAVFLSQVVAAGNAAVNGIKCRFGHPGECSDAIGTHLGRAKNFRLDGDIVRADLHLSQAAAGSPSGDLRKYVLDLADEDPESFGSSIVFRRDRASEDLFAKQNVNAGGHFVTPDPDNKRNLLHVRLGQLRASDVVDDPAANPGGFFSVGGELAAHAEMALGWIFGLSDKTPDGAVLGGIEPQRVKVFVDGFLGRHGLKLHRANGANTETVPMAKQKFSAEPPYEVTCPDCGHEFEYTPPVVQSPATEPEGEDKKGAKPLGQRFSMLSIDEAKKLVESRPDLVAFYRRQGVEAERKYRQEFEGIATAASLSGDQRKKFEEFYGRDIGTVKEFASLMQGQRAKPVGEAGTELPKVPEAGGATKDTAGEARQRFAEQKTLRRSRGCTSDDPQSEEFKKAQDKYVASIVALEKAQAQEV